MMASRSITAALLRGFSLGALLLGPATPAASTNWIDTDWQDSVTKGTSSLYGAMIAIDAADNLFVTGSFPVATIITARYDQSGNQVWWREFDNPGTREQASFVTIDPSGNVVVIGSTVSGSSNEGTGFVTLKYDPDGNLLWSDVVAWPRGVAVRAATDAAGNVYVAGRAWVSNPDLNTTDEMMTVKYAADGVRQWARSAGFDPTSVDWASSLTVLPGGNVVVTGGGLAGFLTIAYDPGGTELWRATEAASGGAGDVVLGPSGEIYVVGGTWSLSTGNQYLVVAYDVDGNQVSARTYDGYAARRAVVDGAGNVIVTGYATGLPGRAYTDWLTHKIDPGGAVVWSQRYDQHQYNDEFPYDLKLGPDGEVYVTGQGGPGPTSGELSYLRTVTVRYGAQGSEDWVAATFDAVRGLGVVHASNGSVAVVGHSPFLVLHYFGCVATPGVVDRLQGVRAGDDARWVWAAAAAASAYNLWHVADKIEIDRARQASAPPAIGVAGCSPPQSRSTPDCVDVGAVSRTPALLFYQTRALCAEGLEGP